MGRPGSHNPLQGHAQRPEALPLGTLAQQQQAGDQASTPGLWGHCRFKLHALEMTGEKRAREERGGRVSSVTGALEDAHTGGISLISTSDLFQTLSPRPKLPPLPLRYHLLQAPPSPSWSSC